jgi:hypothetical protein
MISKGRLILNTSTATLVATNAALSRGLVPNVQPKRAFVVTLTIASAPAAT